MEKSILLVLVGNRRQSAVEVQRILTEMGCYVKTRLGIHDGNPDECTNCGLIILELIGDEAHKREVVEKLKQVESVHVELVELSI